MTDKQLFRRGSTTYYFSSLFFPKAKRTEVAKLYSFVRTVDDLVDRKHPDIKSFRILKNAALTGDFTNVRSSQQKRILQNMQEIQARYHFKPGWTKAFLSSMTMDAEGVRYQTIDDVLTYSYGSAEVIGLMMARIMSLPERADSYARMQGRAMQWINFIRDIKEDNSLKRCYFPIKELQQYGLPDLQYKTAKSHPKEFKAFISFQLERYAAWQAHADNGYRFIPRRYAVPIRTSADMHDWTAGQIAADPFIVCKRKVRPSKNRVIMRALGNMLFL